MIYVIGAIEISATNTIATAQVAMTPGIRFAELAIFSSIQFMR